MPLMPKKSKKAFDHNVEVEMKAGKPQKQSLAIAFNVKRKAKKMAEGGMAKPEMAAPMSMPKAAKAEQEMKPMMAAKPKMAQSKAKMAAISGPFKVRDMDEMINDEMPMSEAEQDQAEHPAMLESDDDQMKPSESEIMADHFAEGGMIDEEAEMEHAASIAAAIMAKRKKMAEGGQVDIDSNNEEQPNEYYAQNEHAALKENYDEDMDDMSQPEDSNEHSPEHDEEDIDDASIVAAIRRKMRIKSALVK